MPTTKLIVLTVGARDGEAVRASMDPEAHW
jgi:hypothetical protein